jgi:CheY-like chemotaxis protein
VVLLDLKMPKVDGFEVLRRVKSDPALRSIPIVMLTSSRHDPDVRRSYLLGANGYIVKPMDFARYTKALQDFGRFWLEVNEMPPETKDYAHAASEVE